MKTFHSLIRLLGKHRLIFFSAVVALAVGVLFEAAGRMLIRDIVDNSISETIDTEKITTLIAFFVLFALLQGMFFFFAGRWKSRTTENVTRELREKLYDHIQRLSFHYHDRSPVGELVQRVTSDVDAINRFFGDQIPGFLQIVFKFSIYFGSLAVISVKLAFGASAVIPLIVAVSVFFFGKIYKAYDVHQTCEGEVSTAVQENLHGIRVVRSFAQQDRENSMFEEKNRLQQKAGLNVVFWHASYWPVAHVLCGAQFTGAMFLAGWMVIRGELTLGTMVASTFLFNGLIWPLQDMGRLITEISHSFVSFNRIDEILQEEQEEIRTDQGTEHGPIRGAVEFRDLSFSYVGEAPVLKDITFSCRPGEKIALLGETGSGKTTIVNLLPRFYDFDSGELLIDGKSIRKYPRDFLRRSIGIVEQNPFLFSMSVRENIEYSVEREVSFDEVVAVARAAAVHENIMKFPEKYDTVVGEKGVSLSGGQKQRIAIARTLLKDPRILILDDSTSAVDSETEQSIRQALERLLKGRTTFIIAHRIETLKSADRIIVLKEGRILQHGTHSELTSKEGFYRNVFELQTRIENELIDEIGLESTGA